MDPESSPKFQSLAPSPGTSCPGLGGAQLGPAGGQILDQDQSWTHRTRSQSGISTQGGGEERKEASTVQMGHGFVGKARRIFRGLLEGRKFVWERLSVFLWKSLEAADHPQTPISQQG